MSFESFSGFAKKGGKLVLTPEEQNELLAKGLGAGAREAAHERKPHGFERTHKVHQNKKKYKRQEKHRNNW